MNWHLHSLTILRRSIVYAITCAAFAWPMAGTIGLGGAIIGGALGAIFAYLLSCTRLRTSAAVLMVVICGTLSGSLLNVAGGQPGLAAVFDSQTLLNLRETMFWFVASATVVTVLVLMTLRRQVMVVLEIAVILGVFAQLVVAHRYGAIHRPFEIADPILVRGGDPSALLLAVGALAAILVSIVLIREQKILRSLGQFALLALLILAALFSSQRGGLLPHPEAANSGLGLRGDLLDADRVVDKTNTDWTEQLDFRDQTGGAGFQVPVAVVLFHDDYSPPGGYYYFRQGTFSQFNGRRLVVSSRDDIDLDVATGFSPVRSEVREIPVLGDYRSSLQTTIALMADHTRPFALESAVSFTPADNPNPDRFRRAYRAESRVINSLDRGLIGQQAGQETWTEEQWHHYLQLPDDPRYAQLARDIVDGLPAGRRTDPMLLASSVQRWLTKEGIYSQQSKHSSAADPTAHFLFGNKIGYCVHFAHAATYMLRALGVPTRVGSGYMAHESARQGGSALLLTSSDAHAWPEIYLREVGWVVVDIQPERNLDPPGVAPDAELQRLLGQLARGSRQLSEEGELVPTSFSSLWRWFRDRFGIAVGRVLAIVLLVCYLVKAWRFFSPALGRSVDQPRLIYRRELDRLSELGLRRHKGESREAFALRLKEQLPSLTELTAAHLAAAFGSHRKTESKRLSTTVNRFRTELRQAIPLHRRLLGWLTPWSWITSR